MAHRIKYSPAARDDLDKIWDYLEAERGSSRAAQAVVGAITTRIGQLAAFPLSGTPLSSVCDTGLELMRGVFDNV